MTRLTGDTEAEGQSSAPQKHGGDEQERGIFAQTAEQPDCPPAARRRTRRRA